MRPPSPVSQSPTDELRIPMRGYERRLASAKLYLFTRYESPCGVMSSLYNHKAHTLIVLRIPMRGYEE